MKTNNIEGLTPFEINILIQQGGKFIIFPFVISKRTRKIKRSNIYFIRPKECIFKYAMRHFFLNLSLALRIFPLAPFYILMSIFYLIKGGEDYTETILNDLNSDNASCESQYTLSYQ